MQHRRDVAGLASEVAFVMLGWSVPRTIRRSKQTREKMTAELERQEQAIKSASAISNHTATRLERAAADLMERHNQGMMDAAAALRRR